MLFLVGTATSLGCVAEWSDCIISDSPASDSKKRCVTTVVHEVGGYVHYVISLIDVSAGSCDVTVEMCETGRDVVCEV